MVRAVGAEETQRDLLFHDTVAPHLAAYASAAQQRDHLSIDYDKDAEDGLSVREK